MSARGDRLIALAVLVGLGSLVGGGRWVAFAGAAAGWALLLLAVRLPMPTPFRTAVVGAAVATAIIAATSRILVRGRLLFYLKPEVGLVGVSLAVEGIRGVLLGGLLYFYARLRGRLGVPSATLTTTTAAFLAAMLFEQMGHHGRFWEWNVLAVPSWRVGSVWMFVPVGWAATLAFSGYYLMPMHRRIAPAWEPIGVGLCYGATFVAFWLVSWTFFVRLLGRAEVS